MVARVFRLSLGVGLWTVAALGAVRLEANPNLSGSITLHFSFHPDNPNLPGDQSFWSYFGNSGAVTLTIPSVSDISIKPSKLGAATLDWADHEIWTEIPLDTSRVSISHTGVGSYSYVVNGGKLNLDVLRGLGPSEGSMSFSGVYFSDVHGSGESTLHEFNIGSNFVSNRFNVTLPSGAHLNNNQHQVTLENLTIHSGASLLNALHVIRNNLVNHGSGNFGGTVEGNFSNDASSANGDVANANSLAINGQLLNTGELFVPGSLTTQSATSNAGTLRVNGGHLRPQAGFSNNGVIELSAGYINGPGMVTNNATFHWTGGWIDEGELVNNTSAFMIDGAAAKNLFGTLTNAATIRQSGGSNLNIGGGNTLTNQSGALYDITDDSDLTNGFDGGFIDNRGTFRKSGGTGISEIGPAFHNKGLIEASMGTLHFTGGGTFDSGATSFLDGATVRLGGGTLSLTGPNTASGNGTLCVTGGSVVVPSGESGGFTNFANGAKLIVSGGSLQAEAGGSLELNLTGTSTFELTGSGEISGAGTTTNSGSFKWSAGRIEGNLHNDSADFLVNGSSQLLAGGNLVNSGTIRQLNSTSISIGLMGTLVNQAGALYDIQENGGISAGFQSGSVTNAGTWRKSGGTGISTVAVQFSNTGTIAVDSGTLRFSGGPLNLNSSSTLAFELGGDTPAADFGKLHVTGAIALDGTLQLTLKANFVPQPGDTFDILDWGSRSGQFTAIELPALGAGLTWDATQLYTAGLLQVMAGLDGDYNRNGVVDAADYVMWRKGVGVDPTQLNYNVWRANFGRTSLGAGADATSAVPEPAALVLLILAPTGGCRLRRRGDRKYEQLISA